MTDHEKQIFKSALNNYGMQNQMLKTYEECSELINALSKYQQFRATTQEVMTELADVSIMIDQMALKLGYDDFLAERARKVERLKNRIEQ